MDSTAKEKQKIYKKFYKFQKDYERPPKTITECLQTRNKIEEQLSNYEEIETSDIENIQYLTLIKYISYDIKKKKELFRLGGKLIKIYSEYIVLKGKCNFSVQRYTYDENRNVVHTTRFFKPFDYK